MRPNTSPNTSRIEDELLAEMGWVRALARRLVKDVQGAEDLAQETLLTALEANQQPSSLRRWLGGVLRNLHRNRGRAEAQRRWHEGANPGAQVSPSVSEVLERAALQRDLADLVLGLEEPYRSTLLLRYFEDLSQVQIGRCMGVSASTVGTRIERGLRRLRETYEREHKTSSPTWLAFLLQLSRQADGGSGLPRTSTSSPLTGSLPIVLLMSVQAKVLLSAAALITAALLWRGMDSDKRAAARASESATSSASPVQEAGSGDAQALSQSMASSAPGERTPAALSELQPSPSHATPSIPTTSILGRVIDLQGAAMAGLQVIAGAKEGTFDGGKLLASGAVRGARVSFAGPLAALTSNDGTFELESTSSTWIEVSSDSHVTLLSVFANPGDSDVVLVVAPRLRLAGQVIDSSNGEGLQAAQLIVGNSQSAIDRLGLNEEKNELKEFQTESLEGGAFDFAAAPSIQGAFLLVRRVGFKDYFMHLPALDAESLRIELVPTELTGLIQGLVLLPNGQAAAGALVSSGGFVVEADAQGYFGLDPTHLPFGDLERERPVVLHAIQKGFGAAELELPPTAGADQAEWPRLVILKLTEASESLSGRVVDQNGNPIAGVRVNVRGQTSFGHVMNAAGTASREKTVEAMLNPDLFQLKSDAQGHFEIRWLLGRSYELDIFNPETGCGVLSQAYPAGTRGIQVVLDQRRLGRLAGRVVTSAGTPLGGVQLALSEPHPEGQYRIGVNRVTDDEGRFEFEAVSLGVRGLSIKASTVPFEIFRGLPDLQDREGLELVVMRSCHVQFDWAAWSSQGGGTLCIVGPEDAPIELGRRTAGYISTQQSAPIHGQLSPVFVLPEDARAALIMMDGEELGRIPLQLVPGDVQRVKL